MSRDITKKEICSDALEGFPAADEYMDEVELLLKYPNTMFKLPCRQDKHLKTDCYQVTKRTFDKEMSKMKDMKSDVRTHNPSSEMLPPLVASDGSTRGVLSNRSTTKVKQCQSNMKSSSIKIDRTLSPKHIDDSHFFPNAGELLSQPNSSSLESMDSDNNRTTASLSRQNQSVKSSSSLGSFPQINSSLRFPALSKTTTKLPCLPKVPEVLSSFSTQKIHRLEAGGGGGEAFRCFQVQSFVFL